MNEVSPSLTLTTPVAPPPSVDIVATFAARMNLADFQNAVPVLRELAVANTLSVDLKDLDLVLTSEPAFVQRQTWHIDALGAGQTVRIPNLDLRLDGAYFARLTEAENAVISLSLHVRAAPDHLLATQATAVELLPRNQWGGLTCLPDMVAAFVQPNEPFIDRLLKQAADVLRQAGKDPALNGYQGGAKRAWELASALWSAVGAMGLDYALPPASFELRGQKIRSPAQIAESGLATCLDTSLLFCAALEQAGLNPILVFTQGHVFTGVWLKKEEFSTTVVDDVTAIRKRVKLKELLLFETTLVTQRPLPAFSHAAERANFQVAEAQEQTFELAVDIRRARLQRIKPLASVEAPIPRTLEEGATAVVARPVLEEAPDLPVETQGDEPEERSAERPDDRLARWQRKLLDLSLRNNLLSFKGVKKAIRLDAPEPSALEDLLSEGVSIKLLVRPDLMDGQDPRDLAIYEAREREDVRREHARDALKRKEVFVGLAQDEMDARLLDLYRTARLTVQETGANALFLAIGFLSWTRDAADTKRYRAPLLLLPVTLDRRSVRSGFSLKLHDDEPRFNPTLIEMLRQDFDLELGIVEGEMPRDDHGLDVQAIWNKVALAIKDIKGWDVLEEVVLSTFSFAKYLMWKDLTERTDQLKLNPVVRHLIESPRERYASTVPFANPRTLDRDLPPQNMFCPLPADSSQLAAVVAASRGKDFVLIGPPGTGKSQTISNLIAQCLAEKKRVLFVSEKMAALDVVYRRLKDVGLGDFCLELHSSKASKSGVLAQLKRSWDASATLDVQAWQEQAQRLGDLRASLNGYVERLHHRHPNGLSAFEAIGRVVAGAAMPTLGLSWPSSGGHDAHALTALRDTAERLDLNAQAVGHAGLASHPLAHVAQTDWSPTWQAHLLEAGRQMIPVADEIEAAGLHFLSVTGLPPLGTDQRVRAGMLALTHLLPQAHGRDWRFVLQPDARAVAEGLQRGIGLIAAYRATLARLPDAWASQQVQSLAKGIALVQRAALLRSELTPVWNEAICADLARAIELVNRYQATHSELSLQYKDPLSLDLLKLQRDWQLADKAGWPGGWLKRRALSTQLQAAANPGGTLDAAQDIQRLVRLAALQAEMKAFSALTMVTDEVWCALDTDLEAARCAITFQQALAHSQACAPWNDSGFDMVASGRCGAAHQANLLRMRELQSIDLALDKLSDLGQDPSGVWQSHQTDLQAALAMVDFQAALAACSQELDWQDQNLDPVSSGRCGVAAAKALQAMRQLRQLSADIGELAALGLKTEQLWRAKATDLKEADAAIAFHAGLSAAIGLIAVTPEKLAALRPAIQLLLGDANMLLDAAGPVSAAAQRYQASAAAFEASLRHFGHACGLSEVADLAPLEAGTVREVGEMARSFQLLSGRVHAWCAWQKVRGQAMTQGLGLLVTGIEQGIVASTTAQAVFNVEYARWWLNAVVDADEVLRTFVSTEHEQRIRDFKALDDHFTVLTRQWVRATLCADLPSQESVSRDSEWGLLSREMHKKKNHLPLRALMTNSPSAVTKLAPCLLMSPLSIAQYLPSDTANFDVVVFDEASQIPVWDAIGAIARGKQVVMVGDPKQLPPTAFFDRAESDADDTDVEADLESILDECMGANLPTIDLSWHYRSRHESLIAFSNQHYYGGGLVTFPSPVTADTAVSFHHVQKGVYEKGGARTNKPEAMAVVAHLVAQLKSTAFRASGKTVGVVTFNSEQQRLIEDLLDAQRRKDPSLESYFAEDLIEPLFVKNLESVQGDERDVMYFSLTYGPDISGAVSMNFGPMNKQGGERRLNVAITRARQALCVFSSLLPEQMDLSRTQATGVRDLKHFMEFAQRGARALGEAVAGSLGGFESPFEEAVAAVLSAKGWRLHPQVGVSAFRIDLGVVDEDAPGSYLAGIECDGATYHSSATARDRDKLREQVLRGLGWNIVRIWSTDWWIDATGTADRIDAQLRRLLAERRQARLALEQVQAAQDEAAEVLNRAMQPLEEVPQDLVQVSPVELAASVEEPVQYARQFRVNQAEESAPPVAGAQAPAVAALDANAFFEAKYDATLLDLIDELVLRESPVLGEAVARSIARSHGWVRTGARILERVMALAMRQHAHTVEDAGTFFWHRSAANALSLSFRRPVAGSSRVVEEVAMAELTALAGSLLAQGLNHESGLNAMCRELGLQRVRTASRERLTMAWNAALATSHG